MRITKIKVTNFKSFRELDLDLGNFNVLIGANAAGKSNFLSVLRLLRDMINHGLNNAISIQGGIEYLRNLSIGSKSPSSIEVTVDLGHDSGSFLPLLGNHFFLLSAVTYKLALSFESRGKGFKVKTDHVIFQGRVQEIGKKAEAPINVSNMSISVLAEDGVLKLETRPEELFKQEKIDEVFFYTKSFLQKIRLSPNQSLAELPSIFTFALRQIFGNIAIYDFDPKLPKKTVQVTGLAQLEEDGGNLVIALMRVLANRDKNKQLSNLLSDLLPFVERLGIEKFAGKSLLFKLREKYHGGKYFPASLVSDGTINLTALLIALYFESNPIAIIEEPERNLHPFLISRVVNMMKDAARKKQIITTTHNPEVVRHAGLDNIYLIARDKTGFSTITKPSAKEEVRTFLENELGIEELYVRNML